MKATQTQTKSPKQTLPIFICASLVGEVERQRSFSKNFNDHSLYRFVDSIDGRAWLDEEADLHVSEEMKLLRERERLKGKLWINPAAIACALTHRDKLLVGAEKSNVILCEDDIKIQSDFIDLWKKNYVRERFSMLNSVVLLHYISINQITTSSPPVGEFGKYRIFKLDDSHVSSSACYFVSAQVASGIRHYQTPIRISADSWSEMKNQGVIPCVYVVHPSPCSIAGMASNLGYGSEWQSNAIWLVLLRRLKRWILRRRKKIHEDIIVRR